MASAGHTDRAAQATVPPGGGDDAPLIRAIPLRHPWRNTFAVIVLLLFAGFLYDAFFLRTEYHWDQFGKYLFDARVSQAAMNTLIITVLSMVSAIVLGVILAVMRLSPNPVFKSISWVYLWVFRGTPVYVQLVFWGLLFTLYKSFRVGLPFQTPWVDIPFSFSIDVFWLAVIGLALNEASYMAEIVRAGILSVDRGQEEAATALGMSWSQTMRRIVIPQSMRIIIPPTGNEVISMLKTTSLVIAVPYSFELYGRTRDIAVSIFDPIPLLLVACAWYLLFTSILMIGQHFLEKRFARGLTMTDMTKPDVVEPQSKADHE
ncbi:amino acid ABC transporter permease [Homoserinimonas sp. OAct 916]|uniref:amino acid ABC transporter permease n=1 Tax=Homoserinimonas sp. OAct 916 TaxID=2211450 RepID=UPI000DBEA6AA|nr:amino acid ABC transporter permease [Homoserinimonas sp. OAct 916]